MRRAVQALKAGYETPVFPLLDACRVALGARLDAELAHRKGRIMQQILDRAAAGQTGAVPAGGPATAASGHGVAEQPPKTDRQAQDVPASSGCPFAHAHAVAPAATNAAAPAAVEQHEAAGFEAARQKLYSWDGVTPAWRAEVVAELAQQAQQLGMAVCSDGQVPAGSGSAKPLAFLDHAWGPLAPLAQVRQ